jgi:hypothetical protein
VATVLFTSSLLILLTIIRLDLFPKFAWASRAAFGERLMPAMARTFSRRFFLPVAVMNWAGVVGEISERG